MEIKIPKIGSKWQWKDDRGDPVDEVKIVHDIIHPTEDIPARSKQYDLTLTGTSVAPDHAIIIWKSGARFGWDSTRSVQEKGGSYVCIDHNLTCPRCEMSGVLPDDYLCEKCRYGN